MMFQRTIGVVNFINRSKYLPYEIAFCRTSNEQQFSSLFREQWELTQKSKLHLTSVYLCTCVSFVSTLTRLDDSKSDHKGEQKKKGMKTKPINKPSYLLTQDRFLKKILWTDFGRVQFWVLHKSKKTIQG